jgi:hypothetical protein
MRNNTTDHIDLAKARAAPIFRDRYSVKHGRIDACVTQVKHRVLRVAYCLIYFTYLLRWRCPTSMGSGSPWRKVGPYSAIRAIEHLHWLG